MPAKSAAWNPVSDARQIRFETERAGKILEIHFQTIRATAPKMPLIPAGKINRKFGFHVFLSKRCAFAAMEIQTFLFII